MTDDKSFHQPVLRKEAINYLNPRPGGRYVDGTLGEGGHTRELLEREPSVEVVGFDRDQEALDRVRVRLSAYTQRLHLVHGSFSQISSYLRQIGWNKIDGILLDLGVSSFQLDNPQRGFSYRFDGPLDMRMDSTQHLTAARWINQASEKELYRVFKEYAEEPQAKRLVQSILNYRSQTPIVRTSQFLEVIHQAFPHSSQKRRLEARCFQALRIVVNNEIEELQSVLGQLLSVVKPGGRIVIITFHSLEDRLVKNFFKQESTSCLCSPRLPICTCGHYAKLKILTKKPVRPQEEEIRSNPRAASAKLRAAEMLHDQD